MTGVDPTWIYRPLLVWPAVAVVNSAALTWDTFTQAARASQVHWSREGHRGHPVRLVVSPNTMKVICEKLLVPNRYDQPPPILDYLVIYDCHDGYTRRIELNVSLSAPDGYIFTRHNGKEDTD
jgi:hypothetical protein